MLTIGEFSKICFVTKKTLRHYDEIGLLRPEHIAENGYRYYTVDQLRTMLLISRLKGYGFSLPEIAAVLENPAEDRLAARLMEKRRALEQQLQTTRRVLQELDADVAKLQRRQDMMEQNLTIKTVELAPMQLFGIRRKMNIAEFSEGMADLYRQIGEKQVQPIGGPMAFYHSEEFSHQHTDIELAVPVAAAVPGGREYPGGLHCCTTMVGPYTDANFSAAYAGLVKWIEEHGYRVAGAPFDQYVRGGENVPPEECVTEIYFPITK